MSTVSKTIVRSHALRLVNTAIRKYCRSKPTQHGSFQTISDLHHSEIEHDLLEAVKNALTPKGGA
ncbi:hypothetical protein [Bradyrhizobium sp. SYSU BS000235]|uniref:hypothetical protein n=1 Tax=Bradyrhizobium sp. SYSU BS000235 TaxID=3411332 RepID=UPI003C715911